MDAKRIIAGALGGGIAMYVLGHLIFRWAVADFYAANAGSATGVARAAVIEWAVALGTLALAVLVTLAVDSRPGKMTMRKGFTTGAIVGFLVWFGVDLISYGVSNSANLMRTMVDPVLEVVRTGIAGAIIALILARLEPGRREPART
jgi:hypothetical protein